MPESTADTLIVGAGPTGLTLAIELHRLGLSARLVDKNSGPAQYSQALVVQARTLEQWERYGIASSAVNAGRPLHRARMFSEGEPVVDIAFDQIPGKYPFLLFLPQRDTEQLLTQHLSAIGGAPIERHTELLSCTQDDSGVTSQLRLPDGTAETHRSAWILGADGSHSTLRDQLHIPFSGESVQLSFILGDLALQGDDLPHDGIAVHLHNGEVIFLGRLTDQLVRVIHANHNSAHPNPATQQAMQKDLTLDDFNHAFQAFNLHLRATGSDWMTPFRVNDRQASRYRVGRALIAGDASHIHSPVGGQGMNTGIQDAANLAWKLAAVHRGDAPMSLLDTYESERAEVGRELLERTGIALKAGTSASPVIRWLRDQLLHTATQFEAVRRFASGFVSETAITYRTSPISEDRGGRGALRPGDRVPNPELPVDASPEPRDLLAPLASARALLLVINSPSLPPNVPADSPHLAVRSITTTGHGELAGLFGADPAYFVVRPDGYLGFRALAARQADVLPYLRRIGALAPANVPPASV